MRNFKKMLPLLYVILWMMLIFYLSDQPAKNSNNLSQGLTKTIINTAEKVSEESIISFDRLNYVVRKNAHFFAYLTLAVLMMNLLKGKVNIGTRNTFLALTICILYSITDEVHQLFVIGRSGEVRDVLIDSSGSLLGVIIHKVSNGIKNKN